MMMMMMIMIIIIIIIIIKRLKIGAKAILLQMRHILRKFLGHAP